jgi:hypothetical protein
MAYLYGTTTELVYREDIAHIAFSRPDLVERGWTKPDIKYYLGPPDYRVRRGRYNTGPVLFWKKARVREIEALRGWAGAPLNEPFSAPFEEWQGAFLEIRAAHNIAAYLQHRASCESTTCELTPEWFLGNISYKGGSLFNLVMFGITLDPETGKVMSDDQQPHPGFLDAWLNRSVN